MKSLEGVLEWFLTLKEDVNTRPAVTAWIAATRRTSAFALVACDCELHRALYNNIRALYEGDSAWILTGTPWDHVAFWMQLEDFFTSTRTPDLGTEFLVRLCRSEMGRIISDKQLQVPSSPLPGMRTMGPVTGRFQAPHAQEEIDNEISATAVTAVADAHTTTTIDNEKTMPTIDNDNAKNPLNNTIAAVPAGLAQPLEEVMKADSEEERAAVFLGQAIERAAGLVADRISETTLRIARQQLGAALPPATSNGHGPKIEHLPTLEIEEVP
jgi:hypothetical protein